jgi:hypothetical protein
MNGHCIGKLYTRNPTLTSQLSKSAISLNECTLSDVAGEVHGLVCYLLLCILPAQEQEAIHSANETNMRGVDR